MEEITSGSLRPETLYELATRSEHELQDTADDVGIHLLLTTVLEKDDALETRVWTRISQSINGLDYQQPDEQVHDQETSRLPPSFFMRHRWWLVLLAMTSVSGLMVGMSPAVQVELGSWQDGAWQSSESLHWGSELASQDQPLQVLLPDGPRLDIHPSTHLVLPEQQHQPYQLTAGALEVSHQTPQQDSVVIASGSGAFSTTGKMTISRSAYRDRIKLGVSGTDWQDTAGTLQHLAGGQTWDVPHGGVPRPIPAHLVPQIAQHIDHHQPISASLMDRISPDGLGSMVINPEFPAILPFMAPPAYDLRWVVQRQHGEDSLVIQIPHMSGEPVMLMLDGWQQTRHGFELRGAKSTNKTLPRYGVPVF